MLALQGDSYNQKSITFSETTQVDWERLEKMNNLEELHFRNCPIKEIPPSIGKLKSLRVLEFISAPIKNLPKEIKNLENLTTIHLVNTQIESLPSGLEGLRNLKTLNLMGSTKLINRAKTLLPFRCKGITVIS